MNDDVFVEWEINPRAKNPGSSWESKQKHHHS